MSAAVPFQASHGLALAADQQVARISEDARGWSETISQLTEWENRHLLTDPTPAPEKLREHKNAIRTLMLCGQFYTNAFSHPDFKDDATAEMVNATQQVLRRKRRMFHEPPSEAQAAAANKLLKEVFPE